MKEFYNWRQEAEWGESSELSRLERRSTERVSRDTGSLSGVGIGAQERVQWVMWSEDQGWVTLGGQEVCCEVGAVVGNTIGDRGNTLSVWMCSYLVGAAEVVGVGSETRGIELRGNVAMGGEVGGVFGTTIGSEFYIALSSPVPDPRVVP